MHRFVIVSLLSCLGLSCYPSPDSTSEQSPLIESTKLIRRSVVPILIKDPGNQSNYEVIATAFFIHENGLLATASHVLDAGELYINYDNVIYSCSTLESDLTVTFDANDPTKKSEHVWDIAVLQVRDLKAPVVPVVLSNSTEFSQGQPIAVYGFYDRGATYSIAGLTRKLGLLTSGIVSAQVSISTGDLRLGSRLVLDITGGPGSSGGPVFDPESCEVIGIVSEGKLATVLEVNGERVNSTRIPKGVLESEPVIHLREWLRQIAPKLGYD